MCAYAAHHWLLCALEEQTSLQRHKEGPPGASVVTCWAVYQPCGVAGRDREFFLWSLCPLGGILRKELLYSTEVLAQSWFLGHLLRVSTLEGLVKYRCLHPPRLPGSASLDRGSRDSAFLK